VKHNYDVIIVGGGPAGTTLAYELASQGTRTLILEKAKFPRYKCCAGGLSVKAARLLDINIGAAVEDTISKVTISFAGANHYHSTFNQPIMYTVTRQKFDHILLKRALEADANILQETGAHLVQLDESGVRVLTGAGTFQAQFIAGADGAGSIVARTLGTKNNNRCLVGLETEVSLAREELAEWESQVRIDLGCIPAGYAWVFPKSEHLSIGIACLRDKARELKGCYGEFLNSLKLGKSSLIKWSGSLLPVCTGKTVVAQGRAVLLGDAAGLADPLSGEGLYNAILSAKLAAQAIFESLRAGMPRLDDYQRAVEEKILPEMRIAHIFSQVLNLLPQRLFWLLKRDERIWKNCCYLCRGETNYRTIKNKITSLGGLYNLVLREY